MTNNHGAVPQSHDGVLLCGLDGTNPLGFLAAIGAFRLLSIENSCVTMTWQLFNGTWRPTLFGIQVPLTQLGNELHTAIGKLDKSVWSLDKKLPFPAAQLRDEGCNAVRAASSTSRGLADSIASLGVECCIDDKANFKDTALRMVRAGDSAGQGLLAYGKRILDSTTATEIQNVITETWLYQDKQCALRWDPAEDRGYALQWGNPSDDGALSVRGANCLALAAMTTLPTMPMKGQVETTGFGLKEPKQSSFTWPIWKFPVSLDVVTSLLEMSELQREQPPRATLECRGIAAVYRCDRVMTSTYYANFTPARRVA
jgi:hypothetical protein